MSKNRKTKRRHKQIDRNSEIILLKGKNYEVLEEPHNDYNFKSIRKNQFK